MRSAAAAVASVAASKRAIFAFSRAGGVTRSERPARRGGSNGHEPRAGLRGSSESDDDVSVSGAAPGDSPVAGSRGTPPRSEADDAALGPASRYS